MLNPPLPIGNLSGNVIWSPEIQELCRNLRRFIRAAQNVCGESVKRIHLNKQMTGWFVRNYHDLGYDWSAIENGSDRLTYRGIRMLINADRFRLEFY